MELQRPHCKAPLGLIPLPPALPVRKVQPTDVRAGLGFCCCSGAPGAALGFCSSHDIALPRSVGGEPTNRARVQGGLGGRCSFLFPLLFSLCCWRQPLTLLTSLPMDQESGLGFPVTKVTTQELPIPNRALLPEAFSLWEAVTTFPIPPEGQGLYNMIASLPGSEVFHGVLVSVALRIRFKL